MRISQQTYIIAGRIGVPDTVRLIGKAGFDAFDFSILDQSEKNPVFTDNWKAHVAEIKAAADEVGIVCNQAHAPFPSLKTDESDNKAYNETIFDRIVRAMEASSALGASLIVVHPIHHLPYRENTETLFHMNMDFYRSLAPYAKRLGIKVALENMWQKDPVSGRIVDSTCSTAAEFIRYFDTLADPDAFTCCLDLGHCSLCGYEAADMIRALGADRLGALHVHDNDSLTDVHTLPFLGSIKWQDVCKALREIGYRGDFTYEAHAILQAMPTELVPETYRFTADVARHLVGIIEE